MAYSKYDPADFIVPPELGKGKSQRVQCYIQSGHYRALNVVARSGVFPFEERNDVIRYCIQEGLQKINVLEPKLIGSIIRQANMMIHHNREEIYNQQFLEWIASTKIVVQGYIGRGEDDAAKEEIGFHYRQIVAMPNEPDREFRWKMKYLDELRKTFPALLPVEEAK
jgi:hypothetical protein